MRFLFPVLLFTLFCTSALAKRLNFIESHQLRLSGQQDPLHWLVPFHSVKHPDAWESNIFYSQQKDVLKVYKEVQTKDQDKIQERLSTSFGKPYDLSAKVNAGYRNGDFAQFFSSNGGAVLLATDPVFPELQGFLFHDYTSSTSYVFRPVKEMVLKTQLNIGVRKAFSQKLTTGDLVESKVNIRFNKEPYVGFMELSLRSLYSFGTYGRALFEINSLPLINEYQYWDTFLGYQTPDIFDQKTSWFKEFSFYGGYSPFYGGHYDVSRTFRLGNRLGFGDFFSLDVFTLDKFYPGVIVSSKLGFLELSLFTFERAYDDYEKQKSREFGFNLKTSW